MISMSDAARDLEVICEAVTEVDDITPLIAELFESRKLDLAQSVDQRIRWLEYLDSQITHCDKIAKMWADRKSSVQKVLDRIKLKTMEEIKSFSDEKGSTVPMVGSLGGFKIVKNSKPTLIVDENDEDIKGFYTVEKVETVIDKAALRQDLMNGIKMKAARLHHGEHLRWR